MPQVSVSKCGNMVNIAGDAVCPVPFRSTQCRRADMTGSDPSPRRNKASVVGHAPHADFDVRLDLRFRDRIQP